MRKYVTAGCFFTVSHELHRLNTASVTACLALTRGIGSSDRSRESSGNVVGGHEVMEASAALAGPKMPKARRSVPIVLAFLASAAAATYWAPVWVGSASRQPRRTDLVTCHSTQHVSLPNPQNIEARRNYPEYKFDEDGGMYDIIKYPLLTAKACRLLEEYNIYTFMVDRKANKPQIRAAIETIFGVKVIKCNTLIPSSRYQIAYGMKIGRKSLFKKAYVQVKEGDSIDLFPDDPEAV
ncbi:rplW [Symbiodinium sp. CCMP2592]|nr:rplW [Symbiodinium sp. CCMP2592]